MLIDVPFLSRPKAGGGWDRAVWTGQVWMSVIMQHSPGKGFSRVFLMGSKEQPSQPCMDVFQYMVMGFHHHQGNGIAMDC